MTRFVKNKKNYYSKGMVFGVFDNLHHGHKYFLKEASKRCDKLIVVVTPTEIVELLKKHSPKNSFNERVLKIKEFNSNFFVISGDSVLGEWNVLKKYPSDIVFLGYDQQEISKELKKMNIPYIFLKPYRSKKYKSSVLGI